MSKLQMGLIAAAVALACSGTAQAVPSFAAGGSAIKFENFENAYRLTANCVANCLAHDATDPALYSKINPAIAGNIHVGDIFVGILNIQNVISDNLGGNTYDSIPGNRFTGYFAQEVLSLTAPPAHTVAGQQHITLGTTADPFGILLPGEMFRLYADIANFNSGGTVTSGINTATNFNNAANLWASLAPNVNPPPDGYAYTHTDPNVVIGQTGTIAFFGVDIKTLYPLYSAGTLLKINAIDEQEIGGGTPFDPEICSAAAIADPTISCTDMAGQSKITNNANFGTGLSPWMFASDDPFRIQVAAVPEPATLALVGLALAGLGLRRRRVA